MDKDQTATYQTDKGEQSKTIDIEKKEDPNDKSSKEDEKEEEKIPNYGGTSRLTKEYGKGLGCYIFFGYIFSILNGAIIPVFALIFRDLIDTLGKTINPDGTTNISENILRTALMFVGMGVGAFIFTIGQYYFWSVYGIKIAIKTRQAYFNALVSQDITYHDKRTSGIINAELITECTAIENGVGQKKGILWQHLGTFLIGMGQAFYYSWELTLVLTATIPVLVCIGVIQGILLHNTSAASDPFSKSGGFAQTVLTNIRIVQSAPYLMKKKYDEFVETVMEAGPIARKREIINGFGVGFMMFGIIGVMYSVGLYSGARFVEIGEITQGDMFGTFFSYMMAGMGLGQAASVLGDIQKGQIAANKFFHVKERKIEMKKSKLSDDKLITAPVVGEIEFRNVSFSYPSAPDKKVLNNVSFKVKASESLALVGPSGSGKTTIVSLLERYYDPTYGEILIDGRPIEDYDIKSLRNQIGLVSQQPLLFDASVKENIRGGTSNDINEDRIIEVAKLANAHEFITKFENGYNQSVGELGGRMSGGQKQRIVIARALLNRPRILLLDEATSALDSKNEKEVQAALDNVNKLDSQTTISIAHRLSTIKDHTNILVLVNGVIKEYGNHDTLMENNNVYAALVRAQELVGVKDDL